MRRRALDPEGTIRGSRSAPRSSPPYSINGRASPSALALAEPNFITRTEPGLVDLTFFGTAHASGKQPLRVIVAQKPSRAGVDPNRKLIERESAGITWWRW